MNNAAEKQGEGAIPSLEEWRQLYEAAEVFRKTAPWDWMWDSDIFAVQNPEDREMGYCCVLGANREVFALVVYLGTEGLEGYMKVVSGEVKPGDHDALHTKKCLLASFENREDLSKDDLAAARQLGLSFSGANAWPQFQNYQPGYFPWRLTKDEVIYLTLCLQQAKDVTLRFKKSPVMLKPSRRGHYFARVAKKENDIFKWEDAWIEPTFMRKMVIVRQDIDVNRLEKIKRLEKRRQMVWEVDFFYAPATIAEKGKRPYFPLALLWVEQYSYFILFTHITTPDKYEAELIEYCLRAFESAKLLPEEIQVRKKDLLAYLQPLAQRLGIGVKVVKKLKAVDEVYKGMKDFFARPKRHLDSRLPPSGTSRGNDK